MKILVAPDKFAGTLSAPEAARAIRGGWIERCPDDTVTLAPMADGGPGFVDVLHDALGGELIAATVHGPLGTKVPVSILVDDDVAYVETSQACGLDLVETSEPLRASTYGVGEAMRAAIDAGARRLVLGLGGSATNDGGSGMLAALGAKSNVPLDEGPIALDGIAGVDLSAVHELLAGTEIRIAADVDIPLLGMFGATRTFGPQKGLDDADIMLVDRLLDGLVVAVCGASPAQRRPADEKGSGAAGGLGFALMALGAERVSGIGLVADAAGLGEQAASHDLVITGEGSFDYSSRAGKVVHGVAQTAGERAIPCIVLAGRVDVGTREMRAIGVDSAYSIVDLVGEREAFEHPYEALSALATRVARTWSF